MITVEQISERIRTDFRGKLPPDTKIDEATVLDDLGISSLELADMVFSLEEEYGVEFDAAKAADVKTLGDLVAVANESIAGAPAAAPATATDAGR